MELIYDYMKDDMLRRKLNVLTQKTFGFDFENWVTEGYFEGDYIPYSFIENGKILSNVSVNKMKFNQNGVEKNYIQIGTVMTDECCRKRGLAKRLMKHVMGKYESACDGVYLFANLSALDFYRKIGFIEGVQYQYSLKRDCLGGIKIESPFIKANQNDEQIRFKYMDAVRNSAVNAALDQMNKYGLQMFYTADLRNVYYTADRTCFAVMQKFDETLVLESVISKEHISMKDVITHIDEKYNCLKLGFSPCAEDCMMFETTVCHGGDDDRLFYRGKELERIEQEMLFFPQLSHA